MTPYVISLETFAALKVFNFSQQYDATPSPLYQPCFLGGKDTATRQIQINLYDAVRHLFGNAIINGEIQMELSTDDSSQINGDIIRSFKVMAAMMLYIKSQIDGTYWVRSGSNSTLGQIIRDTLDPRQTMTEQDIYDIFSGALRNIQSFDLDRANQKLKNDGFAPIYETQWLNFINHCNEAVKKKPEPLSYKDYPVTFVFKPLGESIGGAAGLTTGLVGGAIGSNSMPFMPANRALASAIKSGIIVLGLGSTFGAPVVAPIMAATLLSTFMQMFCARYLHHYTSIAGGLVAQSLSVPMDYIYRFIRDHAYALLQGENDLSAISGLRLDGTLIINGMAVENIIVANNDEDFSKIKVQAPVDEKSAQQAYKDVLLQLHEKLEELKTKATQPSVSA